MCTTIEVMSRYVESLCRPVQQSPIAYLMEPELLQTAINCAPEKMERAGVRLQDFSFIPTNEARWRLSVVLKDKDILMSYTTMETLWASSLASYLYYTSFFSGRTYDKTGVQKIDSNSDPLASNALKLLLWKIHSLKNNINAMRWPATLPIPHAEPVFGSDNHVADEITLMSCGLLFRHEFAHVSSGHESYILNETMSEKEKDEIKAKSTQQENEADCQAVDWIFSNISDQSDCYVKRVVGAVNAFLITTVIGLYDEKMIGGSLRAFSFNRLSSFLDRINADAGGIGYAVAFSILSLHWFCSGRSPLKKEFDDFKEPLEAMCDQLAKEFKHV